MMKYKGAYLWLFSTMMKKDLVEQFGPKVTKKALKGAKPVYREMLMQVDDIGADNPMASNIYGCFVFLAIWKAADGAIDVDGLSTVITKLMRRPLIRKVMGGRDLNKPEDMRIGKEKFRKIQAWADAHPEYKDKTWDFNFDDSKHKDGSYYYFTRCPIEKFAREHGFLEVLPVCCDIDYLTAEASHGVLHREFTLATGGSICDYWIVPDGIKNPE